MHDTCKRKYVTENFAARIFIIIKNVVIFIFVIAMEYEINFTSKIFKTMVVKIMGYRMTYRY